MADEPNWDDLQPAQQQTAPPTAGNANWDDLQPVNNAGPTPEGPIKSGLREAASNTIPTVLGAAAGMGVRGALLGSEFGPVGVGVGTVAGAVLGAYAASKAQDALLKGMGSDDSAQRAVNAEANPVATTIGAVAPAAIAFSPGDLSTKLATRLATGTITGGLDIAQQAAEKGVGNVSPGEALTAAGVGAALPNARPWLGGAERAGARIGGALTGRPGAPETAIPETPGSPPQTPQETPESQTSGALSGRPPAPGEGGAVNPAKAIPTEEESAAVTRTPSTTSPGPGAALPHDPDVQAKTVPANMQSGDGFVAVQSERDQSTGFNEKKTRMARPGTVETMPSTPLDTSAQGADIDSVINGVWGEQAGKSFTPQNMKDMGGLPVTPPPPEGMELPPKGGLPPAKNVQSPLINQPTNEPIPSAPNPDEGLLEVSRMQREGAAAAQEKGKLGQEGEAFQTPTWEALTPVSQAGKFTMPEETPAAPPTEKTIPEDLTIPSFLKRGPKPTEEPPTPKSLSSAATPLRDLLGIKSTGAADDVINKSTPEGQAPRVTQNTIESFVRKNQFVKAFNDVFSVRGSLTEPGAAAYNTITKNAAQRDQNIQRAAEPLKALDSVANSLPPDQQLKFQQSLETGKRFQFMPGQQISDLIKAVSKVHQDAQDRLREANILDPKDYAAKFWPDQFDNPSAAKKMLDEWEGKGLPTISDAMKEGLKLKNGNPIQAAIEHAKSAEHFAELNKNVNEGIEDGYVREADERLPTDVKLDAPGLQGRPLYAPEGWARNFNNHYDQLGKFLGGDLYQGYRKATNLLTQIQLVGPVFHGITMAGESMIAKVGAGIQAAARGDFKTALQRISEAPAAPYTYTKINAEMQKAWLDPNADVSQLTKRVVDIIRDSGGRVVGYRHDPTLQFGEAGVNFFKSWKRADLRMQIDNAKNAISAPFHQADTAAGLAKKTAEATKAAGGETLKLFGNMMRGIGAPMFEHYIPAIKNGINYEHVADFLASHPDATDAEAVKYTRKAVQSTDNRIGEMINDNIFWSNNQKAVAQGLLRAYSWFLGTVGEIGGGSAKLATTALSEPKNLRSALANDPRAAYVLGLFAVNMTAAAIYQYIKTGKGPESGRDLLLGRTGGNLRSGSPERAIFPGYMKDVLGWAVHPTQEAMGKFAVLPQTIMETLRNKDWRDDPIAKENAPALTQMKQYLGHALKNMEPIYVQQVGTKTKPGSNISLPERLANIRPTSVLEERNPAKDAAINRAWKIKENHDRQNR